MRNTEVPWSRAWRLLVMLVTALALAAVAAACGGGNGDSGSESPATTEQAGGTDAVADTESESSSESIKIGVAMKTQVQPRWQFEVDIMQQKADEMGIELLVQWANDDSAKQTSQVENLLSQGVQALIIVPVDDQIAASMVDSAHASDVPVVSYDIGIQNADVDYFTTRDNYKVGELQSQGALEFAPEGKYGLIKGDQANNVAREIAQAWSDVLGPVEADGTIEIVVDQWHAGWSPEDALKTAENALTANNNDIAAFVTANDGMAGGVVQALSAQGLAGDVYVSGLDVDIPNAQLIVEGKQTMSVWTRIDDMAVAALDAAVALAKGETPPSDTTTNNGKIDVPTKLIDVVAITADNMCEFITEIAPPGWISVEDVYVNVDPPVGCGE